MSIFSQTSTNIHVLALDGIVNVNSLFTMALFLGLTASPPPPTSANTPISGSCAAGKAIAENLVTFHVYSFGSFLFSSLIALAMKQTIKISDWPGSNGDDGYNNVARASSLGQINTVGLRIGMLLSSLGSVCGCGFLMMALINLVQVKLGTLACGSAYTWAAIVPLVVLVPGALLIYICLVLYSWKR